MSCATTDAQRAAVARWQAKRRRLIGYGQWEPFVDAQPVRAHARAVMALGMSAKSLESALGLPDCGLKNVLWGSNGRQPADKIRKETAVLVLAFWPSLDDFAHGARIDPTGTRRRVRALATLGWTNLYLACRIGMQPSNFRRSMCQKKVTAGFARAVRNVYNDLWMRVPRADEVPPWVALRNVGTAREKGWEGPLAWDDDTIDNPQTLPQTDAPEPLSTEGGNVADRWLMGESVILGPEDRKAVLAHLFEWTNDTTGEIASRLGMTPAAAERQWHRIKEKAAADGRRVWRRVYVPREKDLTKIDMGAAA